MKIHHLEELQKTCEKLLKLSSEKIKSRGKRYFKDGRVYWIDFLTIGGNEPLILAGVKGKKEYVVDISPYAQNCECPYAQQGYICKHMVATCLRALDIINQKLRDSQKPKIQLIKDLVSTEPHNLNKNKTLPAIFIDVNTNGPISAEVDIVGVKVDKDGELTVSSRYPTDRTIEKAPPAYAIALKGLRDQHTGNYKGIFLLQLADYPYKLFRLGNNGKEEKLAKLDTEPEPFKILALEMSDKYFLTTLLPTVEIPPYFFHIYPDEKILKLTTLTSKHKDFYDLLLIGVEINKNEIEELRNIVKETRFELVEKKLKTNINPVPVIRITEGYIRGEYRGNVVFKYGDVFVKPRDNTKLIRANAGILERKLQEEKELIKKIKDILDSKGFHIDKNGILRVGSYRDFIEFVKKMVPELARIGVTVLYGKEKKPIRASSDFTINLSIESGEDWFEVKSEVLLEAEPLDIPDQNAIKEMLANDLEWINLSDGTIVVNTESDKSLIELIQSLNLVNRERRKISKYELLNVSGVPRVKLDEISKRIISSLKNLQDLKEVPLPQLKLSLRDYQKKGYYWLYYLLKNGFGGILADDMGLGKTVQVIALMAKDRAEKPYLVIAPTTVVSNWQLEIQKFAPYLRAHVLKTGKDIPKEFKRGEIYITSYSMIQRHIDKFKANFRFVVLDEAQAIKNPFTKRARAVKMLKSDFRLALTGTPIENSLIELWSIFDFLMPGFLGNLDKFRSKYVTGGNLQILKKKISPFILRRTKENVLPQLPSKVEQVVFLDLPPAQRKVYNSMLLKIREDMEKDRKELTDANFKIKVLSYLLKLRQLCLHPHLLNEDLPGESVKLHALTDMLDDIIDSGHRVLIFSQFVKMLKIIEKEVNRKKFPYLYLDGSTTNRQELIDKFASGEYPVFLLSLKAGGVGINLTKADYVIIFDPWWNPAVENQAIDRTHRIGQDKTVFVYKLITKNTVEEKILRLQERKKELVKDVIPDDSSIIRSLTPEEIAEIFRE